MGLSASIQRLIFKSTVNGEGGTDQMKRAQKLIYEMRTSVPDFNQHVNTYSQLAKYLATDETCTPEDILNAYNTIKQALENRGKQAKDNDVMQVLNQFKSMMGDSDISFLYQTAQKSGMNKEQVTDFLRNIASNNFGTATWKSGVITYLNNIIQQNSNNNENCLVTEKTDLETNKRKLLDDYLNNQGKDFHVGIKLQDIKNKIQNNMDKTFDLFK